MKEKLAEFIAEYEKGCSNDGHLEFAEAAEEFRKPEPENCPECTRAFLNALKKLAQ